MFSLEKPANSINDVVALLQKQHKDHFIYRGQTTEHGRIIPSIFRKTNLQLIDNFLIFPSNQTNSRLDTVKATFAYVLMKKFGNVVGNYLAQQYIAQSGCIDVTEDIDVAAFFARMTYPNYEHPVLDTNHIGVIYRFNKNAFTNNLRPSGVKKNPFDINATLAETPIFIENSTVDNVKANNYVFKNNSFNKEDKYYVIQDNITAYSDLKPFLYEISNNYSISANNNKLITNSLFKRANDQLGGMIQPKYLCKFNLNEQVDRYFSDVIGVEDIYNKYEMEKFYFKHSNDDLKYNREDMWPSMTEDLTFATICLILASAKEILNLEDTTKIEDIVDIGYKGNSQGFKLFN